MAAHHYRRPSFDVIAAPPPSGTRPRGESRGGETHAALARSPRSIVDTILQSSTVQMFESHDVTVAPLGAVPAGQLQRYHETVSLIGFEGPTFTGTLTLSLPPGLVSHRAGTVASDWTQELANQLHGRLKNRLAVFQVPLRSSLPRTMSGAALERLRRRTLSEILYRFRSRHGDVIVTLDAPIHEALLAYCGSAQIAREGDVILF
jgi:hypothetical protein